MFEWLEKCCVSFSLGCRSLQILYSKVRSDTLDGDAGDAPRSSAAEFVGLLPRFVRSLERHRFCIPLVWYCLFNGRMYDCRRFNQATNVEPIHPGNKSLDLGRVGCVCKQSIQQDVCEQDLVFNGLGHIYAQTSHVIVLWVLPDKVVIARLIDSIPLKQ